MVVFSVKGVLLYVCWILKKKVLNGLVVTSSNEFCGIWARFFFLSGLWCRYRLFVSDSRTGEISSYHLFFLVLPE
jgi:hypothetical protein